MLSSDGGETTDAAVDSAYGHPPVVLLGVGLARASCFRVVFTVVNADRAHHIGWLKAVDVRRERFVPFFVRDEGNPKRRLVADVLIVGDESSFQPPTPGFGRALGGDPSGKALRARIPLDISALVRVDDYPADLEVALDHEGRRRAALIRAHARLAPVLFLPESGRGIGARYDEGYKEADERRARLRNKHAEAQAKAQIEGRSQGLDHLPREELMKRKHALELLSGRPPDIEG